jgi:hypothetical protein
MKKRKREQKKIDSKFDFSFTWKQLFVSAMKRKRCKCNYLTEFSHDNIRLYLLQERNERKWDVIIPNTDDQPPSAFPVLNDEQTWQIVKDFVGLHEWTNEKIMDLIDGHCETVAVALSTQLLSFLLTTPQSDELNCLSKAYTSLHLKLSQSSLVDQIRILFKAEKRGNEERVIADQSESSASEAALLPLEKQTIRKKRNEKPKVESPTLCRQYKMWRPIMLGNMNSDDEVAWVPHHARFSDEEFMKLFCIGSEEFQNILTSLLSQTSTVRYTILPLYIFNYIWDGDELTLNELKQGKEETAQYSIHCAGLVLDNENHRMYVADPNGSLVAGSNMEFLTIPYQILAPPMKASTSISRWDREKTK